MKDEKKIKSFYAFALTDLCFFLLLLGILRAKYFI